MTQTNLDGAWKNLSKETIPAYGIVRVVDTETQRDGSLLYNCDLPNGVPGLHVVNQNVPVRAKREGTFFTFGESVHPLRIDSENPPKVGDHFGPQPHHAEASPHATGWQVIATTKHKEVVIAARTFAPLQAVVKLKEDIDEDDEGDCILMFGKKLEEEPVEKEPGSTTPRDGEEDDEEEKEYVTLKCVNRFSDLEKDAIALATYFVNGWEIFAAKCEE